MTSLQGGGQKKTMQTPTLGLDWSKGAWVTCAGISGRQFIRFEVWQQSRKKNLAAARCPVIILRKWKTFRIPSPLRTLSAMTPASWQILKRQRTRIVAQAIANHTPRCTCDPGDIKPVFFVPFAQKLFYIYLRSPVVRRHWYQRLATFLPLPVHWLCDPCAWACIEARLQIWIHCHPVGIMCSGLRLRARHPKKKR